MDTSHSKGKSAGKPAPAKATATSAFWIRLDAKEEARPFAAAAAQPARARRSAAPSAAAKPSDAHHASAEAVADWELNDRGKALLSCWRELGRLRPGIQPDACAIGPHEFRGILMLAPDGAQPPTLSEAVRLFKVMAALRLSQLEKGSALPRNARVTEARAAASSAGEARLPSALWRKGYSERALSSAQEISAARKTLG